MATLSPGGSCHRALAFLADRPAALPELKDTIAVDKAPHIRRKAWHVILSLLDHKLIVSGREEYFITEEGRDALASLRAGEDFVATKPTVRIFTRPLEVA
jgi:hypothetical protein